MSVRLQLRIKMDFLNEIARKWERDEDSEVKKVAELLLQFGKNQGKTEDEEEKFSIEKHAVWSKWIAEFDLDVAAFSIVPGFLDVNPSFEAFLLRVGRRVAIPQHFDRGEICMQALRGSGFMGTTSESLEPVQRGDVRRFAPAAPKCIRTADEELLLFCVRTFKLKTFPQFVNSKGAEKFAKELAKYQNIEGFYDKLASDYDDVVRAWGYNLPEVFAKTVARFIPQNGKGLDLACGNGLSGQALKDRNLVDTLTGVDFSNEMLKKAEQRPNTAYSDLIKADLHLPLDFIADDQFDFVTCVGASTYLSMFLIRFFSS